MIENLEQAEINAKRKRITKNPFRPDYYWLEGAIYQMLQKHQEQIIREIVEVISKEDKDRTLA